MNHFKAQRQRLAWIYERKFLTKKIHRLLDPNFDLDYYNKHYYRPHNRSHHRYIFYQDRIKIFWATQAEANHLLGFERPFWYFKTVFFHRHHEPPWFIAPPRPRSYKYKTKAGIHEDAQAFLKGEQWIDEYYNEPNHIKYRAQFLAEVERQKRIHQDDTAYLLASPANREALQRGMEQIESGQGAPYDFTLPQGA